MLLWSVSGCEKYVACVDLDQYCVFIVDIVAKSFIHMLQPFQPFKTEDGEDDQYTVEAMVMTSDGKDLILSNCYDNNLNVYDIKSMKKKHEWKGKHLKFIFLHYLCILFSFFLCLYSDVDF